MSSGQLTSQRFWDNMERVTPQQIAAIERDLAASAVSRFGLDLRCLLFDATNFFTFLDSFNQRARLPQRGPSKEGRDNLRILGLALLVTSDGEVPLFHHTYAGNQHDTVTFHCIADELLERCRSLAQGACDITLVYDKGNNSEDNLAIVGDRPFHFVGSLVPTHHQDLLAVTRKAKTRLEGRRNGSRGRVPTVDGVQKKVKEILRGRHMADLFAVKVLKSRQGLPRLSFRFRDQAYQHLCSTLLGKTMLFTDRTDWSDEQIVLAYRAQHHIEADFRRLKDPHYLTFRPTFHWTDQKLRVHAFYCVLALMMLNLLRRQLAQVGIPLSVAKMMDLLADIHEVTLLYPAPPGSKEAFARTVLSEMDPTQRRIVEALGLERYRGA